MSDRDDPKRDEPGPRPTPETSGAAGSGPFGSPRPDADAGAADSAPEAGPAGPLPPTDPEDMPAAPAQPRPRGFGLAVFLAVAVGIGAAGGLVLLWRDQNVAAAWLAREMTEREAVVAAVDTLRARIANLETRVDETAAAPAAAPPVASGPDTAALALQADIAGLIDRLDRLEGRVGALAARLDQVEQAQPAAPPATRADLEAVRARAEGLGAELAALRPLAEGDKLDSLGMRAYMALGTLRRAVESGATFAGALDVMRARLGALPEQGGPEARAALETLSAQAEAGTPTVAALRAAFEPLAGRIVAAPRTGDEAPLSERVLDGLRGLVTVRQIDSTQGEGVEARVARAETALATADVAGAVAALEGLEEGAAAIAAPWLERARAHLEARAALDRIDLAVASALGEGS